MVIPDGTLPPRAPKIEFVPLPAPRFTAEELARPTNRLAATIIDICIILVPIYILLSAPFKRWLTTSLILGADPDWVITSMIALSMVLMVTYQTLTHHFFSATIGKMVCGITVAPVFADHKIGFWGWAGRSCIWVAELLCLGLPWLSVFSNRKRRPLHDRVADTVVVCRGSVGVPAPAPWERTLVYSVFASCLALVSAVAYVEFQSLYQKIKGEKALSALIERDIGQCEVVSNNLEEDEASLLGLDSEKHKRLKLAMSLYASGLADKSCLEAEVEREMAMQTPVSAITYLAQAFIYADDAEVSNAYLDQICSDHPDTVECSMSKVVSKWSDEDWEGVENTLLSATRGSGYLEVWGVRHFMKQGRYDLALEFLDSLMGHRELADFSMVQRTKALFNLYRESESIAAYNQAAAALPKEDNDELSSWLCAQQLSNSCVALESTACRQRAAQEKSDIDFEMPASAMADVLTTECHGDQMVNYLAWEESANEDNWRVFFRANLKRQKGDMGAAHKLFSEVVQDTDSPMVLRVEAARRALEISKPSEIRAMVKIWNDFESKEVWVKVGNLLFAKLIKIQDGRNALEVARLLGEAGSLSPKALTMLATMMDAPATESVRKPASVGTSKKNSERDSAHDSESE